MLAKTSVPSSLPRLRAALVAALTLTGIASTVPPAHADDAADEDREELRVELNLFVIAVIYSRDNEGTPGDFSRPPARCNEVVAGLKRLGMKPDDIMDGREPYPFRDAPLRCREYAQWHAFIGPARQLDAFTNDLGRYTRAVVGDPFVPERWASEAAEQGDACRKVIDDALAAGASPTMTAAMGPSQTALTLGQARDQICAALEEWARSFGPAHTAALDALQKAAHDRYARFGAAGDRLDWLLRYDSDGKGTDWTVPGCKEVRDPKKLAKALVLMRLWEDQNDRTVTIRRLQFKGNKLVKDTRRAFPNLSYALASGCK